MDRNYLGGLYYGRVRHFWAHVLGEIKAQWAENRDIFFFEIGPWDHVALIEWMVIH